MLEFAVLGSLEVSRQGEPLPVPALRHRALLARLVLARGRVVPVAELVAALWDTEPPAKASHAVQVHVSRVRALLGEAGDRVVTRAPGYLLAVPAEAVDAERFEAAVGRAAGLDPVAAIAVLDQALAWWRGGAYAEFADGFARAVASRLEELRTVARERLADALLGADAVERAIAELTGLVAAHPFRERPHGLLMRALNLDGRQPEALEVFRRFRDRLGEQLGLDPSPALLDLHARVLRGEIATSRAGPVALDPPGPPPAAPDPALVAPLPAPPRPVTSFVGRGAELDRLERAVHEHRIVTLVGPGGVGKTRLAQELVGRRPAGGRPVVWIDLIAAHDPDDLPSRFLAALGAPEPADTGVKEFLVGVLRSTTAVLLVTDSCEHVVAAAAALLERLVGSCPDVAVLATSREPLGVPGEQVMVVDPLPLPGGSGSELATAPAVSLFTDRYRAAGGAPLAGDDLDLVGELCRRLDGLPLAIELAAARARSLGVATVTERPSLDLLTGGRRGGAARHRSLRAVLEWSHDLLEPAERVLFRRLAIFTGWFTLGEVEEVCAGGGLARCRIPGALASLVDRSMIAGPGGQGRYRLLDTVRAFATEQLTGHGEDLRFAVSHARHFTDLAERASVGMRGPEEPVWNARVNDRIEELRAAFRWSSVHDADLAVRLAAALACYARYQMRFELQDWGMVAASLPAAAGHPLRAAALASGAAGAWARGEFRRAQLLARQGLEAAPDGDPVGAAPLAVLGDIALLEGRFAAARQAYREALRLGAESDPYLHCEAVGGLAIIAAYLGEEAVAREAAAACLAASRNGPPSAVALACYFAGESKLASDPRQALRLLEEARRLASEINALQVVGFAVVSLVSTRARAATDPAEGAAAYREAIEHWRRVGNQAQQWVTLRNLVPVLVRADRSELACLVYAAVRQAPVRMPDDMPEAEALAAAVGRARTRLPDGGAAADDRGTRITLEELLTEVLAAIGDQAGSSR